MSEGQKLCRLFEGVVESLQALKELQIPMGLLSNKGQKAVEAAVETFCLGQYFDFIRAEQGGQPCKPEPEIFFKDLAPRLGLHKQSRVLVVGDTAVDMHFAKNIGADSCWASYGFAEWEQVQGFRPTFEISKFQEIVEVSTSIP